MPYTGTWPLSSTMTVYMQTESPNTASAVNADALPTFRIYNNLTSSPIASGTFSLIDSANVLGFYAAFVSLNAPTFSASGTYCLRKQATVSTIVGGDIDVFRIYLS